MAKQKTTKLYFTQIWEVDADIAEQLQNTSGIISVELNDACAQGKAQLLSEKLNTKYCPAGSVDAHKCPRFSLD